MDTLGITDVKGILALPFCGNSPHAELVASCNGNRTVPSRDNPGQVGTSALILPPSLSLLLRFHCQSWSGLRLSAVIASRFGETCVGVLVRQLPPILLLCLKVTSATGPTRDERGGSMNSAWRPSVRGPRCRHSPLSAGQNVSSHARPCWSV